MHELLVQDWIRHHTIRGEQSEPLFSAWERVDEIVHLDPEQGWTLILALVHAAPDDGVLANIAAGPLEDLLTRFFDVVIERVEFEAQRDPKLRRCLTGVWGLPEAARSRLERCTQAVESPL